jgi:hypothetical protein
MPAAPAGRAVLPSGGTAGSPRPHNATRRGFMLGSIALLASLLLPRSAPASPSPADPSSWNDDAYWAFADRLQDHLDPQWRFGSYQPARSMLNANILLTHSAAALAGHTGPARRDDRARALVAELTDGPSWVKSPGSGSQAHVPGWRDGLRGGGIQHLVVDRVVPGGAKQARRLAMQRGAVALIHDRERLLVARSEASEECAVLGKCLEDEIQGSRRPTSNGRRAAISYVSPLL